MSRGTRAALSAWGGGAGPSTAEHYQTAFQPPLCGVGLAIVLTFFLKETGSRARARIPALVSAS
jgi:hypothetical protein